MAEAHIGEYQFKEQLGKGTFGSVVRALHRKTLEEVAIKIENKEMTKSLFLMMESESLKVLQGPGVPKFMDFFSVREINYLVLELLGPNLYQRFTQANRQFSPKTVLMIADQALTRIEFVHSRYYIHRDIKPENFVTGLGANQNQLYLIDFGLAKKFFNENCGMHIPYKEDKAFAGTLEFASRHCHLGVQMSRRDDLESLLYMIIYLFKGSLPWLDHSNLDKAEKSARVRSMKTSYNPVELTQGLPWEVKEMLKYVLRLDFDETPDYELMRRHIRHAGHSMEIRFDWVFDWMPRNASKPRRKSMVPATMIMSTDTAPASRSKRNSMRGKLATKKKKDRNRSCANFKRMMLSMDCVSPNSHQHRADNRNMTEHPKEPSEATEEMSDGSEHSTVKETAIGPVFRDRKRILKAATEPKNKESCAVF